MRSGSEGLRVCFASAAARHAPAAPPPLEPPDADEAPLDGAPPHANVVETTTPSKARKVGCKRDAFFIEATISPFFGAGSGIRAVAGRGQGEMEAGSLADLALRPHPPAVASQDPVDRREAHARPFEFARRVESLKDTEQLRGKGHVEAGAVVADEIGSLPTLLDGPELDAGVRLVSRELPRVAQQIVDGRAEQGAVALFGEPVADQELHAAVRLG